MIAYSSWTGTKTTLASLQRAGWRLLMSPDTLNRCKGKTEPLWPDGTQAPYALDNGAWGSFQQDKPFDANAFRWALERVGKNAEWIVLPDSVENAKETLELAERWFVEVDLVGPPMLAVQNGMRAEDAIPFLLQGAGIFIGGSTEWKLKTARDWVQLTRRWKLPCHMGRVNTATRIRYCQFLGMTSFDGSSVARFPSTLALLDRAMRQETLFGGGQ